MAIQTEVLAVSSDDGETISSARLKMVDDTDTFRPIVITIRRNPGHNAEVDSIDPHGLIAYVYLPEIEQAMDDLLGNNTVPTLTQLGLSTTVSNRRYT